MGNLTMEFTLPSHKWILHSPDNLFGISKKTLPISVSNVYSGADQRETQSSASLAIKRGIPRRPVNSPHNWSETRKTFPFDDVIWVKMTAPNHYLNRCCLVISEVLWHSHEGNIILLTISICKMGFKIIFLFSLYGKKKWNYCCISQGPMSEADVALHSRRHLNRNCLSNGCCLGTGNEAPYKTPKYEWHYKFTVKGDIWFYRVGTILELLLWR